MRALVAGGAGFIGSHLCERLLNEGADVVCVDNLITGAAENVAHLMGQDRFQFVTADVTAPLIVDFSVDELYHLASPASPRGYLRKPLETALVNSIGSQNLLRYALDHGGRLLLASTSEAYGD